MGKKPGQWTPPDDDLIVGQEEKTAQMTVWSPPEDDVVVKKKDETTVSPEPEDGSTQREWVAGGSGSQGRQGPSEKPTKTPGFWKSLGQSAADVLANQVPQIAPSGRLANRPQTYEELVKRYPTYADLTEEKFKSPDVYNEEEDVKMFGINTGLKRSKFSPELQKTLGEDLQRVKEAYPQGGKEAYAMFKDLTMARVGQANAADRSEVAAQQEESANRLEGIPNTRHDINSFTDFKSYMGKLVGQAAGSSVTMLAGGSMGSMLLEMQGAYEDGVSKVMEDNPGMTREEVESGPMRNSIREASTLAGAINSVLEKASFGVVTAPIKRLLVKEAAEQVVKRSAKGLLIQGLTDAGKAGASEGFTEWVQNLVTQTTTNKAAGRDPMDIDWDESFENLIGGVVGGTGITGGLGGVTSTYQIVRDKIKSPQETIVEQKAPIASSGDTQAIESAADAIEKSVENQPTEGVKDDSQNITRPSGEERVGQEPVQAQPEQGGGNQETQTGGVVQSTQEEVTGNVKPFVWTKQEGRGKEINGEDWFVPVTNWMNGVRDNLKKGIASLGIDPDSGANWLSADKEQPGEVASKAYKNGTLFLHTDGTATFRHDDGRSFTIDSNGNVLTQQEEVIPEQEYDVFHGTSEEKGFDQERGDLLWFTDKEQVADQYRRRSVFKNEVNLDNFDFQEGDENLEESESAISEIASQQGIDLTKGKIHKGKLKLSKPLDLRHFDVNINSKKQLSKVWNWLHENGLLSESFDSIDEEVQNDIENDYKGQAVWKLLEGEGIYDKAKKKGFDSVIINDVDTKGNPHVSFGLFGPKKFQSEFTPPAEDKVVTQSNVQLPSDINLNSRKQASDSFRKIKEELENEEDKDDIGTLLANWNGSELVDDGNGNLKIKNEVGRDRSFSRGQDAGPVNESKADFIKWLFSDAPLDKKKYTVDKGWADLVDRARAAIGQSKPAVDKNRPSDEVLNIVRQYEEEAKNPKLDPKDMAIAAVIGKVNQGKYGDANAITSGMAKTYLRKDGTPIDVVAQNASKEGQEVTPDDVWDFMQRYPSGPQTMSTPAGNPKLRQLSDRYAELTGKAINRRTAAQMAEKYKGAVGIEKANAESSKFFDPKTDEFNVNGLIDEMESDPEGYMAKWGIDQETFDHQLNAAYNERDKQGPPDQADREDGGTPGQGQETLRKGGPLSVRFGDTSQDAAQLVQEITSKPLTHVPGLNMGKGLSAGTYLSTEEKNRYEGTPQKATVSITNPFVFKSEDGIIPFRNQVLDDNRDQFTDEDFESGEKSSWILTLEDLSNKGIDKLAELVRKKLLAEGYDSIYLPATETQEGELIVFDRGNVTLQQEEKKIDTEQEAKKQDEIFKAKKPTAELKFIDDPKVLSKSITEKVVDEDGNTDTREITLAKKQAEIKKEMSKLKQLMDCIYG